MEADYVSMGDSPLKRKLPSTNRKAVRKRLKNLENSPDFKVLLAKALEKASGGVECKECLAEVRKHNECLFREVGLSRDYIKLGKERIQERKFCDERASLLKKQLALLEDSNNSLWAHNKKYREEILLLRQKIAMNHGRTHTGKGRGRPKKPTNADGTPVVPELPLISEGEEDEEGG